jgi:hypothetical protein
VSRHPSRGEWLSCRPKLDQENRALLRLSIVRPTIFVTMAAIAAATAMSEPPRARNTRRDEDRSSIPSSAPMSALERRVDDRVFAARIAMERRAVSMTAEGARVLRARFDDALRRLEASVVYAAREGTITEEEARAVRAATLRYRG